MTMPPEQPLVYQTPVQYYALPIAARAKAVRITIILVLVLSIIVAGLMFLAEPLQRMVAEHNPANASFLLIGGLTMIAGGCSQMIAYVVAVVFICMWCHRANNVAHALGRQGMAFTPGWTVGWWFIPFANLVMPFRVMKELWQTSRQGADPIAWKARPASGKIGGWWACYLLSGFTQEISSVVGNDRDTPGMGTIAAFIALVGVMLLVGAGILLLQIVSDISQNLESETARLTAGQVNV
jgi:hypothetical protein